MKRLTLTLTCGMLLAAFSLLNAQTPSWQWGQRGGSASAGSGGPDESVVDMATDPHGNIYILAKALQTGLNVDGHSVTGYGNQDWLITSFTCDGTYRWSKDIGGNSVDLPVALKTDTLGGVYITGYVFLNSSTGHISTDTTVIATDQTFLVVKYDTAGNYEWLRFPQSDTVGSRTLGYSYPYDMDVDEVGNCYILSELSPGAYGGGVYIVPTQGEYILQYDKNGNLISGTPIQISNMSLDASFFMKRDHQNGKYYVTANILSGSANSAFGGNLIKNALSIACFNSSGTFLWQKQNTENYSGFFARPAIDQYHHIYLDGSTANVDTFNGYIVANGGSTAVPFIVKLDSNGNNIWAKNAKVNSATVSNAITLDNNEVIIAGRYPGLLKWAGYSDSLNLAINSGYHIFTTRFDTSTGAVLGMDSLASTLTYNNDATAMASDKFGNFYVGGDFASAITVNGTTLNSAGGGSDFFVAKYGTANCDTVLMPALATPAVSKTEERLRIYPNPATEELNVTGVMQHTTYRLLTVTGTALQQGVLQPGENVIPMRSCATGMYILEMTGDDGTRNVVRVVKE